MALRGGIGKIGKLKGLPNLQRPSGKVSGFEPLDMADDLPEDLRDAAREIGESAAREVNALRRRGIVGTLPELLAESWLIKRRYSYGRQVDEPQAGARIDLVVTDIPPIAIRIQGDYWHGIHHGQNKGPYDREQKHALTLLGYIVVDVWESHIYRKRNRVMEKAVKGVEELR